MDIVPVKGEEIELFKALEALYLTLADIFKTDGSIYCAAFAICSNGRTSCIIKPLSAFISL